MIPGLSKRWETILFLMSGIFISYCIRVSMSVACVKIAEELDWTEAQKGLILSSFYWGYATSQLPASQIATYVGPKWLFGFSILIPSILSIVTPTVVLASFEGSLAVRALLGVGASGTFPAVFHFFPEWIPLREKTIMVTVVGSGMYLGEIFAFAVSGYLAETRIMWGGLNVGGWASIFVWFGILGMLWFPLFVMTVHSTPNEHPTITREEIAIIYEGKGGYDVVSLLDGEDDVDGVTKRLLAPSRDAAGGGGGHKSPSALDAAALRARSISTDVVFDPNANETLKSRKAGKKTYTIAEVPWGAFFTHPASIALLVNNWCNGWIGFMLLSEIPAYLTDELGFELEHAGALAIAPYAANFFTALGFGMLFDYLQNKRGWTTRQVRQWAEFIGLGGASLALVACSFVTEPYGAYALMVSALGFFGAMSSGLGCAYLDVSPKFSSSLNTIGNTVGAAAGLTSPVIVAYFIETFPSEWAWKLVFLLTAFMCAIALVFWRLFQTSDPVDVLNTPRKVH